MNCNGKPDIIELRRGKSKIIAMRLKFSLTSNKLKTMDELFKDLSEKCYEITTNKNHELLIRFAHNGKNYQKFKVRLMNGNEIMNRNEDEINLYEITITDIVLHINLNTIINTSLSQNDLNELYILNDFLKSSNELLRKFNEMIYKQIKQNLPKYIKGKNKLQQNVKILENYCLNEFNNRSFGIKNMLGRYMRLLKRVMRLNLSFIDIIKEMYLINSLGDGSFIPNYITSTRQFDTIDLSLINHNYYNAGVIISYDLRKIEKSNLLKHMLFKFITCLTFNYDKRRLKNLTYYFGQDVKIYGCWNGITDINELYGFNAITTKEFRTNTKANFDNTYINWAIRGINEMMEQQKQEKLCYLIGGEFNILSYVPYKGKGENFEDYAERVKNIAREEQEQEELNEALTDEFDNFI